MFALTGCGGGGSTPVLTTPVPTATAAPTVSAKDRSVASNFAPNYIPADATRYLHWASNKNLRVFIRPAVNSINDSTPNNTISNDTARMVLNKAIDNWTTATNGDFTFALVDSADNADIEVVFVNSLLSRSAAVPNAVGLTSYDFIYPDASDTKHGLMKKALIQVIAGQGMDNLVDTTSHELGHALGIEKHSTSDSDLLYTYSLPPATITERDQNTLFYLYYSNVAVSRSLKKVDANSQVHSEEVF